MKRYQINEATTYYEAYEVEAKDEEEALALHKAGHSTLLPGVISEAEHEVIEREEVRQ
jgi:hypothetical protein